MPTLLVIDAFFDSSSFVFQFSFFLFLLIHAIIFLCLCAFLYCENIRFNMVNEWLYFIVEILWYWEKRGNDNGLGVNAIYILHLII